MWTAPARKISPLGAVLRLTCKLVCPCPLQLWCAEEKVALCLRVRASGAPYVYREIVSRRSRESSSSPVLRRAGNVRDRVIGHVSLCAVLQPAVVWLYRESASFIAGGTRTSKGNQEAIAAHLQVRACPDSRRFVRCSLACGCVVMP